MNKNFILKADILDIIFEKRNKDYGAYDLRKFYPSRLKLALGFMFLIAATFSAFTYLPKRSGTVKTKVFVIDGPDLGKAEKIPEVKKPEVKKPDPVKADVKPAVVDQKAFLSNIRIVDKTSKSDSIIDLLPTDIISTVTINVPGAPAPFVPVPPAPGTGVPEKVAPKTDLTTPRDGNAVDVLPSYPGGMDALRKFLEKHLQTPDELENGETVQVRIKFVVDYTGKLQSFVTVLDGGDAYNKEVVRVLKKMPNWIPGKANGESVPVYFTIPVKFVMTD